MKDRFTHIVGKSAKAVFALGEFSQPEIAYQEPLDGHGLSYLAELKTEYKTLVTKEPNAQATDVIEEILRNPKPCWDDLYSFELALIKLLPEEKLRRKIWTIRKE